MVEAITFVNLICYVNQVHVFVLVVNDVKLQVIHVHISTCWMQIHLPSFNIPCDWLGNVDSTVTSKNDWAGITINYQLIPQIVDMAEPVGACINVTWTCWVGGDNLACYGAATLGILRIACMGVAGVLSVVVSCWWVGEVVEIGLDLTWLMSFCVELRWAKCGYY